MSASHGGIDNTAVVENFKEALTQRIGEDRFGMWFDQVVAYDYRANHDAVDNDTKVTQGRLVVSARGQFAVDRLRKHFIREMRAAAAQACGCSVDVSVQLASRQPEQTELPGIGEAFGSCGEPKKSASKKATATKQRAGKNSDDQVKSLTALVKRHKGKRKPKEVGQTTELEAQPWLPELQADQQASSQAKTSRTNASQPMTLKTFVAGGCNQLAFTAATMACENPSAASPLFLSGPTGTGKSHLLAAIADQFRRRHRMRRVIHLSAESFTNDFISSVGTSGLPAFRRRYRDVDALLIDDIQFVGAKRATLRELLYTVETLCDAGRPLVFSGCAAPTEINGLTQELSGRLASGLVCPLQNLDSSVRESLLRRAIGEHCILEWPEEVIAVVNAMLAGDGRVVQGVVRLVGTLQRMYSRMPTMDEIHHYGGQLLRSAKPTVTLSAIERAVAQAFQLPAETLRSPAKTRTASEPRMLAMYLSRQLTSAAFSEIGRFYGGRSHSTAIVASRKVEDWLESGKTVGRGAAAVSAREALNKIESIVRSA